MYSAGSGRRPEPLASRELRVELAAGLLVVAASVAIGAGFHTPRDLDVPLALALVVALAVASRVRFALGAGFTTPAQLVFVPMLAFLPPALLPVACALGYALAKAPDALLGKLHPDRLVVSLADSLFAVGPALVIAAAGQGALGWGDADVLALAFLAQVLCDTGGFAARTKLALGIAVRPLLPSAMRAYLVDAALTPIGFIAAVAAAGEPFRALLVLPLVGVFWVFAQEREHHIENALQLSNAYRGTALLLGDVLEDKDAYTASHSHGVVWLSLAVADRLRLDPAARRRVEFGALLHDIGKIAVPAEIINKPGPLDAEEWAVMKLHTVEGQQMLDRVGGVLGEVGRVVRSSHEHYDGTGYPDALAGEAIPIESRIVACCDAFSAMTTTRSYRKAMSMEAAREELLRNQGTQFDPNVVDALLAVIREQRIVVGPDALDAEAPARAHSAS
jgi:HD-GYP domain-containing protein (c-di-GMP phosphodiesterase class II)